MRELILIYIVKITTFEICLTCNNMDVLITLWSCTTNDNKNNIYIFLDGIKKSVTTFTGIMSRVLTVWIQLEM